MRHINSTENKLNNSKNKLNTKKKLTFRKQTHKRERKKEKKRDKHILNVFYGIMYSQIKVKTKIK